MVASSEILEYDGYPVGVVRFGRVMESISSAVLNGGISQASELFIMQVPKNYCHDDPRAHAAEVRDALGLPADSVGMMTAAEVDYVFNIKSAGFNGMSAEAVATAGLSNHVVAGDVLENWTDRHRTSMERAARMMAGTINIAVISPVPLTDEGKVNIMIPLVEAKSAAMADRGFRETGTTSDAMAVFSPPGSDRISYTGTGSDIGIAAARAVRSAVGAALDIRGEHPVPEDPELVLSRMGLGGRIADADRFLRVMEDPAAAGLFDLVSFLADRTDSMRADGDDRYFDMVGTLVEGLAGNRLSKDKRLMDAYIDVLMQSREESK